VRRKQRFFAFFTLQKLGDIIASKWTGI